MLSTLVLVFASQNFGDQPKIKPPGDEELKTAVQIYRTYGLPLPPERFEYVKLQIGMRGGSDTDGEMVPYYAAAFRFAEPGSKGHVLLSGLEMARPGDRNSRLLVGREAETVSVSEFVEIDDRDSSFSYFDADNNLAIALQLACLGEKEAAIKLVCRPTQSWRFPQQVDLIDRTYALVAKYAFMRYADPDADVTHVLSILRGIYDKLPGEEAEGRRSGYERHISDSILLAHAPTNSRPGSDEALIDGLVKSSITIEGYELSGWGKPDVHLRNVFARGKAIIPTLIAHLKDERATRNCPTLINMAMPRFTTIGELCTEMIACMTSSRHVNRGWLIGTTAEEWWAKAKDVEEEALFKRAIFYHVEDRLYDDDEESGVPLNNLPLQWYLVRFPHKLADLYVESLSQVRTDCSQLARIVDESDLPESKKRELFKLAIENGDSVSRSAAVRFLAKYDKEAALKGLREILAQESPFGTGDDADRRAADLAGQVIKTRDKQLIVSLGERALASDGFVRLNVICGLYETALNSKIDLKSLAIDGIKPFLGDSSVHKTTRQLFEEGAIERRFRWAPSDLWQFEKPVSVRDYAAWSIGRLLEVPIEPEKNWDVKEWTAYRATIEDKLKKG